MSEYLSALAAIIWLITALLPWQPWRAREILEVDKLGTVNLSDVTVIIPARDEALVIADTLQSLKMQGRAGVTHHFSG